MSECTHLSHFCSCAVLVLFFVFSPVFTESIQIHYSHFTTSWEVNWMLIITLKNCFLKCFVDLTGRFATHSLGTDDIENTGLILIRYMNNERILTIPAKYKHQRKWNVERPSNRQNQSKLWWQKRHDSLPWSAHQEWL